MSEQRMMSEEDERRSRALNVRVKNIEEQEEEDLGAVLEPLLGADLLSKVRVLGRQGNKPVNKRHIVIKCPNEAVKAQLLKLEGVNVIEDMTQGQMKDGKNSKMQERTVFLDGLMELYDGKDDKYMLDYFFDNLAESNEEYEEMLQGLRFERIGRRKVFGRTRTMKITFDSKETRDLVMSRKKKVLGTVFYLSGERRLVNRV